MGFAEYTSNLLNEEWSINQPPNESEWPDLLVNHNGRSFGLEVRCIFLDEKASGSTLKKNESHRQMLLKQLALMYYENFDIPLAINISGALREELLSEILSHITKEIVFLNDYERKRVVANNRKTKIYLHRLPDKIGKYEFWRYIGDNVGWVSRLSSLEIQKFINEKEAKADKYLTNIASVRLLLVLDRTKNSGRAEIPAELSVYSNKFEMVYLLSYPERVLTAKCN